MNGKPKPEPEEFAREVLYHLCGIHAEIQVILQMMARQKIKNISEADALYLKWMKSVGGIQKKLYDQSLKKASLQR
jgi:hypothetical protein